MKIHFSKYQGTGNDFIIIDNRSGEFKPGVDQIVKLCDRRFGIGSDGLILIEETGFSDFLNPIIKSGTSKNSFPIN